MARVLVPGKNRKHRLMIYTVSSCTPCKKAMAFLKSNSIEFEYMDIDRSEPDERKEAMLDIGNYLPVSGVTLAYPIIIVDELSAIVGFHEGKLRRVLELE
jgi:glutaredoxin